MDLDELERLEKAAFKVPWKYSRWVIECETCTSGEGDECADPNCDGEETECVTVESPDEYPGGQVVAQIDGKGINVPGILDLADRNGELIVALRNAAPDLLKAARERGEYHADRDRLACRFAVLHEAATQLWDALAEKQREAELYRAMYSSVANHAECYLMPERDALRTRVAELTADLETQRELYGVAAKEREAAVARLEAIGKLRDKLWNEGDEVDALYAERLSAILTPAAQEKKT